MRQSLENQQRRRAWKRRSNRIKSGTYRGSLKTQLAIACPSCKVTLSDGVCLQRMCDRFMKGNVVSGTADRYESWENEFKASRESGNTVEQSVKSANDLTVAVAE